MTILTKLTAGAVAAVLLLGTGGAASAAEQDYKLNSSDLSIARSMVSNYDKVAARIAVHTNSMYKKVQKIAKPLPGNASGLYQQIKDAKFGTKSFVQEKLTKNKLDLRLKTRTTVSFTRNGKPIYRKSYVLSFGGSSYVPETRMTVNSAKECRVELKGIDREADRVLAANFKMVEKEILDGAKYAVKYHSKEINEPGLIDSALERIYAYQLWAMEEVQEVLAERYLDSCGGWTKVK